MISTDKSSRATVLAYIAILSMITLIALLFFKGDDLNDSVKDLLLILSGTLVAIVKDVYSFEFNSTRSSKTKDDTIAAMVENK